MQTCTGHSSHRKERAQQVTEDLFGVLRQNLATSNNRESSSHQGEKRGLCRRAPSVRCCVGIIWEHIWGENIEMCLLVCVCTFLMYVQVFQLV